MKTFFRKVAEFILYFRWPLLLFFVLATALLARAAFFLKIDPSTEALFDKNTSEYRFYSEFKKHFGSDYLIAIAVETSDYLTLSNLRHTRALTTILTSDPRVDRVISLTNALDIRHKRFGVRVEPVVKGILEGEKPLSEFKERVLDNPLLLGNLVSKDGKTGAILIRLKTTHENPNFLKGYVGDLRSLLKIFPWPRGKFYVAGSPVEQNDIVDAIRRDQMFFIPTIALFLVLATFAIYRNLASVIVAMSIVAVTFFWTFGTIAVTGKSMNLVTSLLAPVIMIISVTNAIYMINLFSEIRPHHQSLRETTCLTVEYLGVPCFLAMGTIAAGFLSLMLSSVPAVKTFGAFASLGSLYSYFVAILLTPLLLPLLPFRPYCKEKEETHFFNRIIVFYLEKIEFHLKKPLIFFTLLIFLISLWGLKKIRIDTNLIRDLPPASPLAVSTTFIDERLAGVYALGLSLERADQGDLMTVKTLKKIDEFAQFLESQPEITKVNSLGMVIKKIHQAREDDDPARFVIPEDQDTLDRYVKGMAESDNPDFWSFVSRDFKHLRMEARMKAVGTERGAALEDRVWDYANRHLAPELQLKITGNAVLLGKISAGLVKNQLESVVLAFFVILLMISIFLKSWKMGLLAAVPNLIPILSLYGFMGFIGITLSTPTAMISSVVLGLVVDASVHFLYRFEYEFVRRHHYLQALHHTYRNMGQAMVVSTMILVFGFASSVFASFRPTVYFGLLTSITILFALVCTLVLLPLLLVLLRPLGKQSLLHPGKHTLTPPHPSSIISA